MSYLVRADESKLYPCRKCGNWINPDFAQDDYEEHEEAEGTKDDPTMPGPDSEKCYECDVYGKER